MSEHNSDEGWNKIRQAIDELPREMEPPVDGWPAVRQAIQSTQAKDERHHSFWMPYAIAASLLIAVFSTFLSVKTMNDYDEFKQQHYAYVNRQEQLQVMEQERQLIKANFESQFSEVAQQLPPEAVADIKNNLVVIEQAILDIRKALVRQPKNKRLNELLRETYQSEKILIQSVEQSYPKIRGEI
ncbi:hypothetical protein [Pleionea sediminis]|uniref:hypothetical protein n=1 Tax=Pleionea sediminis TaxID=2569479 RepID=UPI001185709E|nr:hypothetical protein [Pleionea sediminis]